MKGSRNNSKVEGTSPNAMVLLQRYRKTRKKERDRGKKGNKKEKRKRVLLVGRRIFYIFTGLKPMDNYFYICLANEQLYAYKLKKLDEMEKFLRNYQISLEKKLII